MDKDDINKKNEEEKEIDLLELASKLWVNRRRLVVWSICGAVLGLIVAFSIPREYTTNVKLAPEANDGKSASGGLGALASMAGFSVGSSSGSDALYPVLYPDVVASVPFITGLFNVEVTMKNDNKKMTVEEYMENETRSPWWTVIMSLPGKAIGLFSSDDNDADHKLDNFQLTKDEYAKYKALLNTLDVSVDNKTSVINVSVTMQDPLVSAILADTVVSRLQEYITDYRTNKARADLAYAEKINGEAKENYYKAQQAYAEYLDRNQGLALRTAQTTRDRLENETALAFNLYNTTAQQVQKAQAKVQETTPVYAIVTPASVPVRPVKPRKPLILIGFTFLGFVACAAWILFGAPAWQSFKEKKKEAEASSQSKEVGDA